MTLANAPSRQDVLDAINGATTLMEIIDLANASVGQVRQTWGDDLDDARICALLWFSHTFPLAGPAASQAVEVARAVACAVLSPQHHLPADEPALSAFLNPMGYHDTLRQRKDVIRPLMPQGSRDYDYWRLIGKTAQMLDTFHLTHQGMTPLTQQAEEAYPDWASIDAAAAGLWSGMESPPGNERLPAHLKQAFSDAARRLDELKKDPALPDLWETVGHMMTQGIHSVSCGPAGGQRTMAAQCALVHESFNELAAHLGVDRAHIGLNLGIELNCRTMDNAGAFFSSFLDCLSHQLPCATVSFGLQPMAIFHEWTHAYEEWLDRTAEGRIENNRLYDLIDKVQPDPSLELIHTALVTEKIKDATTWLPEDFCKRKGTDEIRRFFHKEKKAPDSMMSAIQTLMESNLGDVEVKNGVTAVLESCRRPDSAALNREAICEYVEEGRPFFKALMAQRNETGQSVFSRHSRWKDQASLAFVGTRDYYGMMSERIARAAESIFCEKTDKVFQASPADMTDENFGLLYPKGKELDQIRPFLGAWYDHLARLHPAPLHEGLSGRLKARRRKTDHTQPGASMARPTPGGA